MTCAREYYICSECGKDLESESDIVTHGGDKYCHQCNREMQEWTVLESALGNLETWIERQAESGKLRQMTAWEARALFKEIRMTMDKEVSR